MLVFSAPRYCDATENKGAYINIRPDLKLNFHKFNAVPHPDIKPMVGSPQHLYRVPISNRILGIRTELSHVTNVISTYFDGSRQIFLINLGHLTNMVKSIERILSAYTGVGIKYTKSKPLLLFGSFLPWPRVEIFLYHTDVGVLSGPGNEFRCFRIRAGDFYFMVI